MSDPGFRLAIARDALKLLKAIEKGDRKVARQLAERIQALARDPYPTWSKQLTDRRIEGRPVRRLRSGVYRVLYLVDALRHEVRVIDIAHRRSVYRDLS
jgi:mRNA-degrading endonuclease RelE of RelBE toxin-antitoxin system